jgi:transcriptional regulator with XRE-family HTH domain
MKLGDKIKTLRTEHNMTQPDLAKELGVTVRTVAYYENNERQPKKTLIVEICKLFNVTTDYLLSDDESFLVDAEDEHGYRGKKKAEEFIRETNTLFAYQEQSGNSSSQDLGKTEIVQKWWKYMADVMKTNPDSSPVTIPLEEVFYME